MNFLIKNSHWLFIFSILFCISSCKDDEPSNIITISAGATAADDAQTAFIEVEKDHIISFEAGTFSFTNTLSMDGKCNVIVRGAGRDNTILDFSGQAAGGEGVLVTNSTSIRFENLTIRDSEGDALKARDCDKISFVNVGTVWSGEPSTDNGAYGLYPVLCREVYIDNCYAYGASDAGIYVGQSDQVILKNSVAEGNVAGIEIENTTNADVFDNEAFDNTGGILVFDLPGLTKYGNNSRVFNNNVHDNNRENFAPEGNIVASVPIGTGCMILSTKNVEIFGNTFTDNNFAGVLSASYLFINDMPNDPNYDPYPSGIYVTGNSYPSMGEVNVADQVFNIIALIGVLEQYDLEQPNVLTDGIIQSADAICIQETDGTTFINMNVTDPTFASVTTDLAPHNCSNDRLPAISFTPY